MYNLPYYKTENKEQVIEFMKAHPFVMLISRGDEFPVATQVPVIFEEREGKIILRAHIMRKTDHHLALKKDQHVLVVFSGAHTYVSASWYTNKQVGSTWNYRAVHAKGKLSFTNDAGLLQLLTDLTTTFENNPDSPSLVKHLPQSYMQSLMKAIVGIEIEIINIDHVFKLSQDRDEESYHNIIKHLNEGDTSAKEIAEIMSNEQVTMKNY
jgi:transcriptional regulator